MKTQKDYENSPKGKYRRQRANAEFREIPWDFTFETWWKLWEDSGMWEERGVGRNAFCMSRIDDEGPYSPSNVEIVPQWQNRSEYLERRWSRKVDAFRPVQRTNAWQYELNGQLVEASS
jgi:hypothetical protein